MLGSCRWLASHLSRRSSLQHLSQHDNDRSTETASNAVKSRGFASIHLMDHAIRRWTAVSGLLIGIFASGTSVAAGQEPAPPPFGRDDKVDLLLSGHVIGVIPQDKGLSVGGSTIPTIDVRGTIGAGMKFDVYPWFTKKLLGAEIETFGLGGSVRTPRTTSGVGTTQGQANLIAISTMYNLMLRYPGELIQPYIGVGAGSSTGILYNVNIQSGNSSLSGNSGDWTFAYQFLGGLRVFLTTQFFLFSEYKYYVAKYSWDSDGTGNTKLKLDFQTHLVSGGIGWAF
jgi:opacity protein-like surface antigen